MNRAHIDELIEYIEQEPLQFEMFSWVLPPVERGCRTQACIAGHLEAMLNGPKNTDTISTWLLEQHSKPRKSDQVPSLEGYTPAARYYITLVADFLDIGVALAKQLCVAEQLAPYGEADQRYMAIVTLKHLRDYGIVDWNRAMHAT